MIQIIQILNYLLLVRKSRTEVLLQLSATKCRIPRFTIFRKSIKRKNFSFKNGVVGFVALFLWCKADKIEIVCFYWNRGWTQNEAWMFAFSYLYPSQSIGLSRYRWGRRAESAAVKLCAWVLRVRTRKELLQIQECEYMHSSAFRAMIKSDVLNVAVSQYFFTSVL